SGADFAERVDVDREESAFSAGDVVVIDRKARRGFTLSTARESGLVAGVVSANPGVIGGLDPVAAVTKNRQERRINLGIVGIVPVNVTDENGAIEPGDLLVTSSTAGHAMKAPAKPRIGTVLGKALGTHTEGRGQVEVLLRLK
ncbi:MAG: hypothetical protein ACYTG4_14810, partial [Planctomycetota bacterium]